MLQLNRLLLCFHAAVETTFARLAISSSRNFGASSGVLPTGSMPMASNFDLISVELTAFPTSAEILLTVFREACRRRC
jgi:hypothetical protein